MPRSRTALLSIVVETAKDALAKLAELTESGHTDVTAKDLLGAVIDPPTLQSEAGQGSPAFG